MKSIEPAPFALGDKVRLYSGEIGTVTEVFRPHGYGWHAQVKFDEGDSFRGVASDLHKAGGRVPVKATKHPGTIWKSDIDSGKGVGIATWTWTKARPSVKLRIVVRGYSTLRTKISEAITQEFLSDAASEKSARAFAHELVASGQAITARLEYQVFVWSHGQRVHEQVWRTVEEIEYQPKWE